MSPLPLTWPYAAAFWLVCIWGFLPEGQLLLRSRAGAKRPDSPDAGSFRLIVVGQWLALAAAFPLAFLRYAQLPARAQQLCFALGLCLLVGGSLLRRHCKRALGRYFTADVNAEHDQPVIDRGAYHWVRHPSYLAGLLMFVGIGFALGSWASVLVLSVTTVLVYHRRIAVEERTLVATLGEPYEAFRRTRKRLIPFIY